MLIHIHKARASPLGFLFPLFIEGWVGLGTVFLVAECKLFSSDEKEFHFLLAYSGLPPTLGFLFNGQQCPAWCSSLSNFLVAEILDSFLELRSCLLE